MPIDFTKFEPRGAEPPSDPRVIFATLPGRGRGYLRDVQGQVLDAWFGRRHERDISIKMNTGTGKTAVGLLALQSSINEGCGPALYVAPDNYLVEQVREEAARLGLRSTDEPDSSDYQSNHAICVVNINKLVNSRSVFGGPGSVRSHPVPIGSVVVDDAHACINTVEEATTVRIPVSQPAYGELLDLFAEDLSEQSPSGLAELQDQDPGVVMRVPMWAWANKQAQVVDSLHRHREEHELMFSWAFVKDHLRSCQAVFSGNYLEIQPMCPPTNTIVSLDQAKRRLFLTATLPDDSVLITHFGASADAALKPVTPNNASDIGDRLILSPLELTPTAPDPSFREELRLLADDHNVVVLVPSNRQATVWQDYADRISNAETIADTVRLLKKEPHVGLVVLVNKYDGIDLPNGACRVLVIDGVPEAVRESRRRENDVLRGSAALEHRLLQRVEQGMGRGVRSEEDYCVVLLLGSHLANILARPQMKQRLGPATRAQLDFSMAIAAELKGQTPTGWIDVVRQCLRRDPSWLAASRRCLAGATYDQGSIEPFAVAVRQAFNKSVVGQYAEACKVMREAINAVEEKETKGWLLEQLATYMQCVDPDQAQRVLVGAIRYNPRVMKPLQGVGYNRASSTTPQAQALLGELKRFSTSNQLILGFRQLVDQLRFETPARDFENAIAQLGTMLGFESQQPETRGGPDVLWNLGELDYLVIECKNEVENDVPKKAAAQLAHSMNWFGDQYGSTCNATPLLVHHTGHHSHAATPPPGARILDAERLQRLRDRLLQFVRVLAARYPLSHETVAELLLSHGLTRGEFVQRYTTRPTRTRG